MEYCGARPEYPLELSPRLMQQLVDEAMARIIAHIQSLPEQAMSYTEGGAELARAHAEDLPETGTPYRELLWLIFDQLVGTIADTLKSAA